MEVEIVTFIVKGGTQLTVTLDRQELFQVRSRSVTRRRVLYLKLSGIHLTQIILEISVIDLQYSHRFVNPGSDSPEVSLIRDKKCGNRYSFSGPIGSFSNPEISTGNKRVRINESSLYFMDVFVCEVDVKRYFFFPIESKNCMNSASYEYRNMSARRRAQFVPIGMPTICWKTFPPKMSSSVYLFFESEFS